MWFSLSHFYCLSPIALLQARIDPIYQKNYAPDQKTLAVAGKNLPVEFALGAFTGFREAIAGLLWVRTDQFFDDGNYAAIMPLIRVITWLDPHQIDVYETGAWHMDYNFTDSQERSDRRYIPMALALISEGIANNPDEPDLYSDKAFVHYFRKMGDYVPSANTFADGWQVVEKESKDLNDETDFAKVGQRGHDGRARLRARAGSRRQYPGGFGSVEPVSGDPQSPDSEKRPRRLCRSAGPSDRSKTAPRAARPHEVPVPSTTKRR